LHDNINTGILLLHSKIPPLRAGSGGTGSCDLMIRGAEKESCQRMLEALTEHLIKSR